MNKDYNDDEYYSAEEENRERKLMNLKRIGIALLVILGVIVIVFLFKGCNKTEEPKNELETTLLEAGKEYYENNEYLLPTSAGECSTVSLKILSDFGLLNPDKYSNCDDETTYVKVCMLESKKLQWVPLLVCDDYKSDDYYGEWKEGTEADLIADESDIKFTFLGKYLDLENANLGKVEEYWKEDIPYTNYKTLSITNYYIYRDKEYIWNLNEKYYYTSTGDKTKASDVKEYYTSSPKTGYDKYDNATTVAKWYTATGGDERVYWEDENGDRLYSATQPNDEFNYYANGIQYTRYTTRTWTTTGTPTTTSSTHMWECASATDPNNVTSYVTCSENINNPTHTIYVDDFYTCDNGLTETSETSTCYRCESGTLKADNSACGTYSAWSSFTSTPCTGGSDICKTVSITVYQWYRFTDEIRSYYPSGQSNVTNEKVFYKTAPVTGALKDMTTETTAYKWYKLVSGQVSGYSVEAPDENATRTTNYRWTSWTDWSSTKPKSSSYREIQSKQKVKLQNVDSISEENWLSIFTNYQQESEMISKFKELGYPVNTLSDINASGDIKYALKLFYRNKE